MVFGAGLNIRLLDRFRLDVEEWKVVVVSKGPRSEIIDGDSGREAALIVPMNGTHLYWPSTVLPVLRGVLEPSRHVLKSLMYVGTEV